MVKLLPGLDEVIRDLDGQTTPRGANDEEPLTVRWCLIRQLEVAGGEVSATEALELARRLMSVEEGAEIENAEAKMLLHATLANRRQWVAWVRERSEIYAKALEIPKG